MDILAKLIAASNALKRNTPKTLAAMTGGEYELFMTRKAFESDMGRFANHLHSRYLLTFEPRSPRPGLHSIQVRLKNSAGNSTLLFRNSYWAKDVGRRP